MDLVNECVNVGNLFPSRIEFEDYFGNLSDNQFNPRDIKRTLARKLVEMYHSEQAAVDAETEFDNIFVKKGLPDEVEEYKIDPNRKEIEIIDLIVEVGFAPSKGEARRLIQQGGVMIDGEKINNIKEVIRLDKSMILKVGKRNFIKILSN